MVIVSKFAPEIFFIENISQEPCKAPHSEKNCESNKSIPNINATPLPFPHSISAFVSTITATTTYNDKLTRVQALHTRWEYENNKEETLKRNVLQTHQRLRCKELGSIILGFLLYESQIKAIYTLFYKRRDLLLFVKTSFGKSLIFQLLPFLSATFSVVLILMPLKLL